MSVSSSVNTTELIDRCPLGPLQIRIIVLCGLVALLDGFDLLAIRSTGVGWAMGLGRLGSFVGPLAIGLLVSRGWQIGDCFAAFGTAALCAALFTSVIGINRSCGAAKADRVPAATGEEL